MKLPALSSPAAASDALNGKEFNNQEGNKVIGTFTLQEELSAQDDLISQIQSMFENQASANHLALTLMM